MRRADRLIELTTHLRQDRSVTAQTLARRLETSVRTVYRDIAALQAQGLPIDGSAGFGYALRAPINLPPLTFDHDQLEAMELGLAYVMQVGEDFREFRLDRITKLVVLQDTLDEQTGQDLATYLEVRGARTAR